ncbi:MAG: RDD family protein [Acidobacteria bacterium]|nr:RDD family protein [Acidobacteriota bacterium]
MAAPLPDGDGRFLAELDVTLDLPLAGIGTRALAQALDLLLLGALAVVAVLAIAQFSFRLGSAGPLVLLPILALALPWAYFIAFELALGGQSPGKRVLSLRVVRDDGGEIGPLASIVRNLLRPIDFLPAAYGVGLVVMFLNRHQKRLGDLAAGTVVVREARRVAALDSHRWPERFRPQDVALLEGFLARSASLLPDRREQLASQLLLWLRRDHAEFVGAIPLGETAWETIERLFVRGAD